MYKQNTWAHPGGPDCMHCSNVIADATAMLGTVVA